MKNVFKTFLLIGVMIVSTSASAELCSLGGSGCTYQDRLDREVDSYLFTDETREVYEQLLKESPDKAEMFAFFEAMKTCAKVKDKPSIFSFGNRYDYDVSVTNCEFAKAEFFSIYKGD